MEQHTFKNTNNCLNTSIYSCLETPVGQCFNYNEQFQNMLMHFMKRKTYNVLKNYPLIYYKA